MVWPLTVRQPVLQQVGHLPHQAEQAAGVVEVLHQELPRRTDVGEERRAPRQRVEAVEIERRPGAAGHRNQMNDRVGRSAECHGRRDGVLEGRGRQDLARPQILPDHLDDAAAGGGGHAGMGGVGGGDRRRAGQGQAQGIDRGRHRRRRAHGHAGAERARHAVFHLAPRAFVERPGAPFRPVLPDVAARPENLAAPVAAQHRSGRHEDGGEVGARRPHDQGGHGLVAAAEQHHAVDGVGAQRFLRVHRQQVAVHHRRRLHEGLAEREQRDLHREAARLPDAALDLLGAETEMRVAGVGVAPRVEDGDDRLAADVVETEARLLGARAMAERAQVVLAEPAVAAQVRLERVVCGSCGGVAEGAGDRGQLFNLGRVEG